MSSKRILIVDDSATSVLWARTILGHARYEVLVARNGREGIEAAVAQRPHLILLGAGGAAADMDGFAVCRALRAHEATQAIPIVMVTARNAKDEASEARRSGADDNVTKPIDKEELLAKVRRLLVAQIGRVAPAERHVLRAVPRPVTRQESGRGPASGSSAA
jgi:two-component system alkaline phosphatase synthesis response regulator PhoP